MIDLIQLREHPEKIIALLKKKDPSFDAQLLFEKDEELREVAKRVEELRHEKNVLAKKGQAGVTQDLREKSQKISGELKSLEQRLQELQQEFNQLYLSCPNVPSPDLPEGGKEANRVVKSEGKKPSFNFPIKNHIDLGIALGWFDFATAATMTGSNFVLYKNEGVKLIYALTMMMLKHNQSQKYQMVLPPYLVNEESLVNAGNFPKFRDQVYEVTQDQLFLIPTAEAALANMYRNNIFERADLPIHLTAWTSCFRREAGSYGAAERGLIRIHEFEKVELFTYCQPEQSEKELDRMVACAESILQKLGLHYRISLLAVQDCSFPSAKTFDIEVWIPSHDRYYEVSSCSNCTDFQARRAQVRYRPDAQSKPQLVHTLNGSSLAIPRLMVALMETYQQKDGSIKLPEIIYEYGIW